MKILEVIHDFLPRHTAGSEVYTYKLSKELVKRGHEVSLFFTESERGAEQYSLREGSYDKLPYSEAIVNRVYSGFSETYENVEMDRLFIDVLERRSPHIIHLQHLINHSLNYIRIAKERSIPLVFTLHDYWLTCPLGGQRITSDLNICHNLRPSQCAKCVSRYSNNSFRLKRLFERYFGRLRGSGGSPGKKLAARSYLKFNGLLDGMASKKLVPMVLKRLECVRRACRDVDLFIAPSLFLKERFVEFGIPEEKILHSDYGFDVSGFKGKKSKRIGPLRFGYTGSLVPHKGVHVLVDAFKGINKKEATLKIYGDLTWFPDYVKKLKESAEGSAVEFMGPFDNRDIPEVLADIDVLVVPSVWFENSPLTIHEAYLSHTPVIVSNLGGMAELVEDGLSGFVFETGNSEALREKIKEMIQNPAIIERMKKNLPAVKTISNDGEDMERIFNRLIQGKGFSKKGRKFRPRTHSPS